MTSNELDNGTASEGGIAFAATFSHASQSSSARTRNEYVAMPDVYQNTG